MCDSTPVRLLFATSDPDIYKNNSYNWEGILYVTVKCNESEGANYQSITTSPFTWNFCDSENCRYGDTKLFVDFTFKKDSDDPEDHLKFIVDTRGYIISRPTNKIKDNSGKIINLDIENAGRHGAETGPESLLELWLSGGRARGIFLPKFITKKTNNFLRNMAIGLVTTFFLVILLYFLNRWRKSRN